MVDHIVRRDGEVGFYSIRRDGAPEEIGKDATVAVEFGVGVGEGRVGLEDGEADGGGC